VFPFFDPHMEVYAHFSSFHAVIDEVVTLLNEFVELLGNLAYG